jgi:hypothetical protein
VLTTGNQLKAARSLLGVDQSFVADLASLSVNTIRNMEAGGPGPIAGRSENVQAVQRALENKGVQFLNHGRPGVRLSSLAMTEATFTKGLRSFILEILPRRSGLKIENTAPLSVALTLHGRTIATASQDRGMAYFEPVPRWEGILPDSAAVDFFGDWAGIAYRRATGEA